MTEANNTVAKTEAKPASLANFKKAISTGQAMTKKGGVTKAEVARAIYDLVKDEERDVIVQVFIEGCGLTPNEPPRVSRRHIFLRGCADGKTKQIFSRGQGASGSPGTGPTGSTPVAMGCIARDCTEDRVYARGPSQMGASD